MQHIIIDKPLQRLRADSRRSGLKFCTLQRFPTFYVFLFADGNGSIANLSLVALLTGILLMFGVAVLLIVVLAVRRKADPQLRSVGNAEDKTKHMGKWM